ncbi:MAG: hypothetical protein SGJ27_26575 [Candidatus Melainabacteria bacterium]|nr:hypothetical protein [Candidatus Melainabacteria bacterium]
MKSIEFASVSGFFHDRQGDEILHPALAECGLFTSYTGLYDLAPIQFEAYLKTGEYVYFKARETKVQLFVMADKEDLGDDDKHVGNFRTTVKYNAGVMPADECVAHIIDLVRQYIARR